MFHIIIPARYQSTRLPGKPLLPIGDKPMISHVFERAMASGAKSVMVATDDQRIADVFPAEQVFLSSTPHHSGTERIAEVVDKMGYNDDDIIVNLQGDEPFIPTELLQQVAGVLAENPGADMATLYTPIQSVDDVFNPNIVKVVLDKHNYALYFSRAQIPYSRDGFAGEQKSLTAELYFRHIGLYAYRVKFIKQYIQLSETPLERLECLEQLRVLAHGHRIVLAEALKLPALEVNTEEDLEKARDYYLTNCTTCSK